MLKIAQILLLMLGMAAPALAETGQQAALAGTWIAVAAEQDGKPAPALVDHRLVFAGDGFTISARDDKMLYAGTYTLDPTADPARIDFLGTAGADKGKVWHGIYRLDGDRLTIVDDAPDAAKGRPTAFAAAAGSGHVLVEFRRSR